MFWYPVLFHEFDHLIAAVYFIAVAGGIECQHRTTVNSYDKSVIQYITADELWLYFFALSCLYKEQAYGPQWSPCKYPWKYKDEDLYAWYTKKVNLEILIIHHPVKGPGAWFEQLSSFCETWFEQLSSFCETWFAQLSRV